MDRLYTDHCLDPGGFPGNLVCQPALRQPSQGNWFEKIPGNFALFLELSYLTIGKGGKGFPLHQG